MWAEQAELQGVEQRRLTAAIQTADAVLNIFGENAFLEDTKSKAVSTSAEHLELAKKWYHSEDYKDLKALRLSAVTSNGVIIEGA